MDKEYQIFRRRMIPIYRRHHGERYYKHELDHVDQSPGFSQFLATIAFERLIRALFRQSLKPIVNFFEKIFS